MEPKPVDISALSGLLNKAKQVMNVVESKKPDVKPSRGKDFDPRESYNTPMYGDIPTYDSSDEREPIYENEMSYKQQGVIPNSDYTAEQIISSKLPQNIKEAMLSKPIPRLNTLPSKVTVEAISKMTGAAIKSPTKAFDTNKQMLMEGSDMITISRVELQNIVDESINRFFKQVYDKTITENTIKKTINLLIKEGKIQVKRKI